MDTKFPSDSDSSVEKVSTFVSSDDQGTALEKQGDLGPPTLSGPIMDKKELWGWYGISWAVEPYSVVVSAVFLPLVLESLAHQAGFQADRVTPCDEATLSRDCQVLFGASWITTTSLPLYCSAISVVLQAFLFVGLSSLADHGDWRKTFLIFFNIAGALSTICLFAVFKPELYGLATALTIISNLCFGAVHVFFYAYLHTLTEHHPEVVEAARLETEEERRAVRERVSNSISGNCFAIGYGGALIMLVVGALIVYFCNQTNYSMLISCGLSGIWWLFFTLVPALWLKRRPGPPLPEGENYLFYSFKQVGRTFRQAGKLSNTFLFLMAWFFLSDGYSTIVSVSILFVKSNLKANNIQLIIAAFIVPFSSIIGNFLFLFIQRRLKISTRNMIIIIGTLYILLPIYGILGFFTPFGLRHIYEIYVVAVYHGLMFGAVQSFCRVLFCELLPPGHENEFFGLYEITDKGSSWIGPLVSGAISDLTGELRYAFYFLLAMLAIPVVILYFVDVEKGKKEAIAFSKRQKRH
ncbi:Autophagy protein 22 [Dimargaris cristalligena]|uniref:Autophagy-related protein n=1 Tax=Dimargaris cristalligena TaxID=215637 RepID=A0A4P9ZUY6_9FUNG|nr:Autophagy protein 22 [Dimargaris cristalligena]RKP37394.1 autophagy-related protein 22-like protein [Dimargaris cristalligena]|eukprot:RKP37394.1 autophagy-related protein 22-like protein [Dimargaris cristalligena]